MLYVMLFVVYSFWCLCLKVKSVILMLIISLTDFALGRSLDVEKELIEQYEKNSSNWKTEF